MRHADGRPKFKNNCGAPAARQKLPLLRFEGSVGALTSDFQGPGCYGGISDSVCCRLAIPDFKKDIQRFSHRGCLSGSCQKTRKGHEDIFRFPRDFFGRVTIQAPIREGERNEESVGRKNFFLRRSLPVIPRRLWVTCFAILVMPC